MADLGLNFKIGGNNNEALSSLKEFKAQLVSLRDQIKSTVSEVKVKISADSASLTTEITALKNQIRTQLGIVEVHVKVKADPASVNASATTIKNQLKAAIGTVSIDIGINQADIAAIRAKIGTITTSTKIKLGIDLLHLNAQIAHARTMIASLITGGVHVNIDATATSLIASIHSLKTSIDLLRAAMGSGGGGGGGGGGAGGGLGGMGGQIAGMVAGLVSLAGLSVLTKMSDDAALLDARLSDLIGTEEELVSTKQRLFDAAQRLGAGYQDMAGSAARMIPSLQEMGKGADDAVKLSEILMTTAKMSGASTMEAASAAQQFAQALGSGVLQGDELKSILENNQALARALAAALKLPDSDIKVTIGMLRKLGEEGKITSEVLANALLGSYDQIMAKADQLPKTFASVWQQIKNVTFKTVDDLNKQGFFDGAIGSFNTLYLKIRELEKDGTLKEWANGIKGVLEAAGGAMSDLLGIATDVFDEIAGLWGDLTGAIEDGTGAQITLFDILKGVVNGIGLVFVLLRTGIQAAMALVKYSVREAVLDVIEKFIEFEREIGVLKANASFFLDALGNNFKTFATIAASALKLDWDGVKSAWNKGFGDLQKLAQDRTKQIAQINLEAQNKQVAVASGRTENQSNLDKSLAGVVNGVSSWIERVAGGNQSVKIAQPKNTNSGGTVPKVSVGAGKGDKDKADKEAKKLAEEAEREAEALARAKYESAEAQYDIDMNLQDKLYENGKISLDDFYNKKSLLIKQSSDAEIAELTRRSATAKKESEKTEIDTALLKAKNSAANDYAKLDDFRKKAIEDRKKDEAQLQIDLARAEGRAYDARMLEIKQKYDVLIEKLKQQGRDAEIIIAVKVQKQEELTAKVDDIVSKQRSKEDAINRANDQTGGWQSLTANRAINDSRSSSVAELQGVLQELEEMKAAGEQVDDRILSLKGHLAELQEQIPTTFESFSLNIKKAAGDALASGINTFFNDLIDGSKSAGDALRDFVGNFVKSIAQIIVQAMAAYAALIILNAIPGGTAVAKALDIAATVKQGVDVSKAATTSNHYGGLAGSGLPRNNIDASSLVRAPRYHIGGIAGFAPGEVPAVLQKGEEVLTETDPRHVKNGGKNSKPANDGSGKATILKVINVFTREQAIEHMNSSEGEKAQLNMVERNASAIRRILEDS